MEPIKHVWFDFSDTIASLTPAHDDFLHQTYADAVGKPLSPEVVTELKEARKKYKSYGAVFTNGLGLPPGYWTKKMHSVDVSKFYELKNPNIPEILSELSNRCPLSIFSNMQMGGLLEKLGIDPSWFQHFISSADVKNPKPALDGFILAVELSKLPAQNLLFVGDDIEKELLPAKNVGMQTAVVWNTAPEADYSFRNFQEILDVVK